jgi:hypothetical protein
VTTRAAHLFALSGVACAQPLYDILGRNPEFFAAHGATRMEIVAFALALLLVPPAVLLVVELAANLVDVRLGTALHVGFVGVLAGLVALQAIRRLDLPGGWVVALALAAAAVAAAAYAALRPVRAVVTVLAAAPALFAGLFLLGSPAAELVLDAEARAEVAQISPARTPVVLLVLDELPLNSLLDEDGRIDPVRFPNLAGLARRADWFPNATSVHEGTLWAVPAILTGRVPRPGELPRLEDHPRNLFTLLGGRYRLEALEQSTRLCPPRLCRESDRSFRADVASLVEDSSVVYLHAVLPADIVRGLPPVTETWAGFLRDSGDEPARFSRFVGSLEPSSRPTLFYGHFLLPHSPWRHLPSGETYDLRPPVALWGRDEVWTDDAGLVLQSFQRHLLQTAYVDSLVGRLVARLEATRLYERALLVVVADHGISFRPSGKRRPVSPSNLEDIAFVPLLVKRPGQRSGRVLSRHVRTVDVLPTIADVLGIDVQWPLDGRSVYDGSQRLGRVVVNKDAGERIEAPLADAVRRRRAALRRQLAIFGSRTSPSGLFGLGRYRGLLGRTVPSGSARSPRVELDFVQRAAPGLLALGGRVPAEVEAVAVVAGGRVIAVAPVFSGRFWSLAPTTSNEVRVLSLVGPPADSLRAR